jgi:hypothetical protein
MFFSKHWDVVFCFCRLQRLGKIYNLSVDIKVNKQQNNVIESGMGDVADVADVGLDRHLTEQSEDKKIGDSDQKSENIHDETTGNIENITSDTSNKGANASPQAPHKNLEDSSSLLLFKCFYCDECFDGKDGNECNIKRVVHMDINHPSKPHYPTTEFFENRLEK